MLGELLDELLAVHRHLVELDLLHAIAFDAMLDPHEQLGPDGLRTGETAPQPSCQCGEEEQRQRRDHQQHGQIDEVLRPEHHVEDIELACRQVEQNRLASFVVDPGQDVEQAQQYRHAQQTQLGKEAVNLARVDLLALLIELLLDVAGCSLGRGRRFVLAHDGSLFKVWKSVGMNPSPAREVAG